MTGNIIVKTSSVNEKLIDLIERGYIIISVYPVKITNRDARSKIYYERTN